MLKLLKFTFFFLFFTIWGDHHKNNNNNINKNSLWFKMKNHLVDKNTLNELEKIFYSFIEIKDNINLNENIQYILHKNIPLNVYSLRKTFEERIISCKDGQLKKEFLEKILIQYIKYKEFYNPISKDLKMLFILNYLSKRNLLQFSLYKFTYELMLNLVYENSHLPFDKLNTLHKLYKYNINLEKRFIFMIEILNLDGLVSIEKLWKEPIISEIIQRINLLEEIILLKRNPPEFFGNIIELYWYLNKNYKNLSLITMGDIIRNNKHLIKNSPKDYKKLNINIVNIILKILPSLIIDKYEYIEDLLDITTIDINEEAYNILSYANGIYSFYKKDYENAYRYFTNALKSLKKNSNNIKEESKYNFWIANSLLILGKKREAEYKYKQVAFLNIKYYSNISYVLLGKKPFIKSLDHLVEDEKESPYDWYFKGLSILAKGNDFLLALSFINSINFDTLKVVSKEMLEMFQSLKKLKNQSFIVLITNKIYEETGMIFKENYPLIDHMKDFSLDKSILLSSILKRETSFRLTDPLISNKGARGPMQIMSKTAKTLCERHNIDYCSKNLLHNISYNLNVAVKCLDELLKLFQYSLFLIIPSYNIGSPTVQKWWEVLKKDINIENFLHMFLFVELIPVEVTKNYTKDVLNNYILFWFIYNSTPLKIQHLLNFKYEE